MSTQTVTVFGATGAQGGSVVNALSGDPTYHIKAVTRNPRSDKSKKLHSKEGVEIVEADLNDVLSIKSALKGSDVCFLVTVTYFRDSGLYNDEVTQGKNVADACKELGIKRVIYSTIDPQWKQSTGVEVAELDQKIEIFNYMVSIDLPVVGVMMGFYFENLLDVFKPTKMDEDTCGFGLPLENASWYLTSVKDLGPVVHGIINTWSDEYIGEIVPVITEGMTLQQMCDTINKHSAPITFLDFKVTTEKFQQLTEKFPRQDDVMKLFEVVRKAKEKPTNDKMDCKKFNSKMTLFNDWVRENVFVLEDLVVTSSK